MTTTVLVAQTKDTSRKFDESDGRETGVNIDATVAKLRQPAKFTSLNVRTGFKICEILK